MTADTITTVSYQGKEYPADMFSEEVRQLLQIGAVWQDELARAHAKVKMAEVALESLHKKLNELVGSVVTHYELEHCELERRAKRARANTESTNNLPEGKIVQYNANGALTFAVITDIVAARGGLNQEVNVYVDVESWSDLLIDQYSLRRYQHINNYETGADKITFYSQNGLVNVIPHIDVKAGNVLIAKELKNNV